MKGQTKRRILLVTPVWKDSARLAVFGAELAATLSTCRHDVHWVIADDGSGPEEHQKLAALHGELARVFPHVSLHFANEHRGKGSVVREAWALYPESDLLCFVDADGSLSPDELVRMLDVAEGCGQSVLAIRNRTDDTHVDLSLARTVAHHLFVLAVRILVGVKSQDPQCGAKILRGADYRLVAGFLQEDGLAFDAEMLTALSDHGVSWKELPVSWIEKDGGKVKPMRDAWGMLAALWRIRTRLRSGGFKVS
ncbi:MAG: glycosyltransferase [Akkermansiaceae bacterium]|nr:glycosyltransferase [Akkermansiaceae bacterium]